MNISNLSKNIFLNDLKPIKSIQIEFENIKNTKELFQSLLSIFTEGMILLYGKNGKVDITTINDNDFLKITSYFQSFGINIFFHKFYIKQIEDLENELNYENKLININYKLQEKLLTKDEIFNRYPEKPGKHLLEKYQYLNSNILKDFKYQIRIKDTVYIIYFDFI